MKPLEPEFESGHSTIGDSQNCPQLENHNKLHPSLYYVENIREYYRFGKVIGEGGYGKVYKAINRRHDIRCAVKSIKKDFIDSHPRRLESLVNEMKILEQVKHQNLLRSYEFLHDHKNYYIVTELVEHGDLFNYYCQR